MVFVPLLPSNIYLFLVHKDAEHAKESSTAAPASTGTTITKISDTRPLKMVKVILLNHLIFLLNLLMSQEKTIYMNIHTINN